MNNENETHREHMTPEMARVYTQEATDDKKKKMNKTTTIVMIVAVAVMGIWGITSLAPKKNKQQSTAEQQAKAPQLQTPQPAYYETQNTGNDQRPQKAFDEAQAISQRPEMAADMFKEAEEIVQEERMTREQAMAQRQSMGAVNRAQGPSAPREYRAPQEFQDRLSEDYQKVVSHFRKDQAWQLSDAQLQSNKASDPLARVEEPLKDLYAGAQQSNGFSFLLSTGSRVLAVTDQEVHSDYPGLFTATVTRPFELRGAKLLCQSAGINRTRIPVQIQKVTYRGNEYTLSGQVQMGRPGIEGRFHNNWAKRLGPELMSTAIGAGFLAWTIRNNDGDRIDTRDAIAGPIIQESVGGLQQEVSTLSGGHPNTVTVPEGTQFEVLIEQNLQITL